MSDLLPCPFCGSTKINLAIHPRSGRGPDHSGDDVWTIGCYECGGSVPSRYNEHGKSLLIAAWNRRALPAAEPAEDVRAGALKEAAAAVDPAIFDHPSVFMGGPSRQAQKTAEAVRAAILALIPEAKL